MVGLVKTATDFELSPTLAVNEMAVKRRAEGKAVLHMGFGESPFPVHPRLLQALQNEAHRKDYLPTGGLPELQRAVASYYENKTGIDTTQFDVIIAPGSKLVLYALQMAIEGDVLIPVPSWVSYTPQAKMLHTGIIKFSAILDDGGFHIDSKNLRKVICEARAAGKNPSKIILNSPSNPTGLMVPESELEDLASLCVEEDIFIISDEIYGFISFDGSYRTIAKYAPAHTAVTSGLSKHLSLGGWRLGIGFIPKAVEGLQNLLCNIASETWSCVPAPVQYAVIEAYKGHEDVETHIRACADIHKTMSTYIAGSLRGLGINVPPPQGAFYNYPDFEVFRGALAAVGIYGSKDLAERLLNDYGLVALPGVAFGAAPEVLTLRLSSCDYDGAAALKAYRSGAILDERFIETYAPNVKSATSAFSRFMVDIGVNAS